MLRKIGRIIKTVVIILLIIFPISIYLSIYNVDDANLDDELRQYLESNSLNVKYKEHKDKYQIAYFEMGSSSGVALLSKGLTGKYQILDVYFTDDKIACIDYDLEAKSYYILFGKSNKKVEKLDIETYIKTTSKDINSKNIFIVNEGLFSSGTIKFHYSEKSDQSEDGVIKLNRSINRKFKSRATLPIVGSGFLLFVFAYTLIISSGGSYRASDSNVLLDNDQRIKQMKPW
jgi:hypothetical protein